MTPFPGAGDIFGRYEIVRLIGRGGMGSVYEARQMDLGRAVALKILSPELAEDPDFRSRFAREARMLAALDSPHVIQVFDSGEQDGALFIATQLVNGRDLLHLLNDDGPLAAPVALKIVSQVASALADAHEAGVLHRDVKPSNVLIRESRNDVFAYLCDFGIARHEASSHTRTGGVIGTLNYLAPELHEGRDATARSDVYSLGCVLWAALTGRAPYERTSEYQVALAHIRDEVPTYTGDSAAWAEINELLRRSMAKDPAERFDSAGAMHAALVEAEEASRGLLRDTADVTGQKAALDADRTQLRVATPVRTGLGVREVGRSRRARSVRALAVAIAAVVALVGLGGTAVALLRGDDEKAAAAPTRTIPSASTSPSPSPSPSARAEPAKEAKVKAKPAVPSPTKAAVLAPTPSAPSPTMEETTPAEQVVCWDGSGAAVPWDCPTPVGRRGMQSVFPSMDDTCQSVGNQGVVGKAEVFQCNYGDYSIRYSRWFKGADRYGYLDSANPGATHPFWVLDGVFYGVPGSHTTNRRRNA